MLKFPLVKAGIDFTIHFGISKKFQEQHHQHVLQKLPNLAGNTLFELLEPFAKKSWTKNIPNLLMNIF